MAKGQSALEYMMTYGWAILIIVIVAVILYSMGIFNPRASVTAASSGFSPFAASAAVCSSSGTLTVAFSVGGLPNGASSANIKGASYTSGSGISPAAESASTTFPLTAAVGSSFNVTFSGVTCNSGVAFSASGTLNYSVSSAAGTANYVATGTIAGTGS